jgi:hypothetical protein
MTATTTTCSGSTHLKTEGVGHPEQGKVRHASDKVPTQKKKKMAKDSTLSTIVKPQDHRF